MLLLYFSLIWSFTAVNCGKKKRCGRGPLTPATLEQITATEAKQAEEKEKKKAKQKGGKLSVKEENKSRIDRSVKPTQESDSIIEDEKALDNKQEKSKDNSKMSDQEMLPEMMPKKTDKKNEKTDIAKEELNPVKGNMTKKEENIAKGAMRNKNEYPTFNDVKSDWDSERAKKSKGKTEKIEDKKDKTADLATKNTQDEEQ